MNRAILMSPMDIYYIYICEELHYLDLFLTILSENTEVCLIFLASISNIFSFLKLNIYIFCVYS